MSLDLSVADTETEQQKGESIELATLKKKQSTKFTRDGFATDGYNDTAKMYDDNLSAAERYSNPTSALGYCVSTKKTKKYTLPELGTFGRIMGYITVMLGFAYPYLDVTFLIGIVDLTHSHQGWWVLFSIVIVELFISGLAQLFFPGGILTGEKIWPSISTGGFLDGCLGKALGIFLTMIGMAETTTTIYKLRGHCDAWQLPQNISFVTLGVEGIPITIISAYLAMNIEGTFHPKTAFEVVLVLKIFVTGVIKNGYALYSLDAFPVALGYRMGRIRPVIHDPTKWFGTWRAVGFPKGVGEYFTPERMRTDGLAKTVAFKAWSFLFCVFVTQAHCLGIALCAITVTELTDSLTIGLVYGFFIGAIMVVWMILCVCSCNMTSLLRTTLVMWPMSILINLFEYGPAFWGMADPAYVPRWMYILGGSSAPTYVLCIYLMWFYFPKNPPTAQEEVPQAANADHGHHGLDDALNKAAVLALT